MMFILGFLTGIAIAILVLVILTYFRATVERTVKVVEQVISNSNPEARGMIIEPDSEADEARARIIERNNKLGRDTKLSELL